MNPRFVIEHMIPFHCKRGPQRCDHCQKLKIEGLKWCIIEIFPSPQNIPVARPITEVEIDGEIVFAEFEFVKCYTEESAARTHLKQLQ